MCKECGNGEVEDTDHFVFGRRKGLERLMIDRVDEWNELGDIEKVVIVINRVVAMRQWRGQLRKCKRSDLLHLLPSPTSLDLCCLFIET